jgi:hypothetical protein
MEALKQWMDNLQDVKSADQEFYNIYQTKVELAHAYVAKKAEEAEFRTAFELIDLNQDKDEEIEDPESSEATEASFPPNALKPEEQVTPALAAPPVHLEEDELEDVGHRLPITGHTSGPEHDLPGQRENYKRDGSIPTAEVSIIVKFIVNDSKIVDAIRPTSNADIAYFRGFDKDGTARWEWDGHSRGKGAVCTNFDELKKQLGAKMLTWNDVSHNLVGSFNGICRVDDPNTNNAYEFRWSTYLQPGEWRKAGGTWGGLDNAELKSRSLNGQQLELYPSKPDLMSHFSQPRTIHFPPQARALFHGLSLTG